MTELTDEVIGKMLEIAKEDLLNPLYEQVVREFEEASIRMDHATNKLAQAVKLTDNEKLNEWQATKSSAAVAAQQKAMIQAEMLQAYMEMIGK